MSRIKISGLLLFGLTFFNFSLTSGPDMDLRAQDVLCKEVDVSADSNFSADIVPEFDENLKGTEECEDEIICEPRMTAQPSPGKDLPTVKGLDDTCSDIKCEKKFLNFTLGDSYFEFSNRLRIEGLYGENLNLINDRNNWGAALDKIAWARTTYDAWFLYSFGKPTCGYDVIKSRLGIRARGIWGDEAETLKTEKEEIELVGTPIGVHSHSISRHPFWIRELWLELSLRDALGIDKVYSLMMGFFPFSLGRGISLGYAYDIDITWLGESTVLAVDQYAPGIKFSGELIAPCVLTFDTYFEIAKSRLSKFSELNVPIYNNAYGRKKTPQRGFSAFSYSLAGRLLWKPYDLEGKRLTVEPYTLYSRKAEQKLRYEGEANMNLGTFGLAAEVEYCDFEFGFDTAFNVGKQYVKGWDSNYTRWKGNDSLLRKYYTKIVNAPPGSLNLETLPVTDDIKAVVDAFTDQGEQYNGIKIGEVGGQDIYNSSNRFHDPYVNDLYGGCMLVFDAAYNYRPRDWKFAITGGFATGDEDPNKNLYFRRLEFEEQHNFNGFIPQQELYQGNRVQSILFLSGQGRIPRPLSAPASVAYGESRWDYPEEYPTQVAHFTNIVLAGGSFECKPCIGNLQFDLKTNILGFWSYLTPRVPRLDAEGNVIEDASGDVVLRDLKGKYFGTELNFILETELYEDLKFFVYGAWFIPGSFYEAFKGIPLKRGENMFDPTKTTYTGSRPRLGDDASFFFNVGLEYKF